MKGRRTVYLDNAATTFPKPPAVTAAVRDAMERAGGNPGRGAHSLSLAAARTVFGCREKIARLVGSDHPENVVFTLNATYALNIAIKSLVSPGSRVAVSVFEHNSVIRPLTALGCVLERFDPRVPADQLTAGIAGMLGRGVRAVVCTHASNVIPLALPVERIADVCAGAGRVCVIDASQSAGLTDIDLRRLKADAVCFPGHKGLYGPAGCGVCVFGDGYSEFADRLKTVTQGGSGVNSADPYMPDVLPERFEAGTLCVPAIAGLAAGIDAVERIGISALRERELRLYEKARGLIGDLPGVKLYGDGQSPCPDAPPILLFNVGDLPPEETAARLDGVGICVRAGLHCAPGAHRALGTFPFGAVRASFGMFNTASDVEYLAGAVRDVARGA